MKVVIDRMELESIKKCYPIGKGNEGICYYLENENKIVKLFHMWNRFKTVPFDNLKNDQIAFPIDILYDEHNNILGYTMYYLAGNSFVNGFSESLNVEELKKIYLNTTLMILKLKNIYMDDNCLDNMLIDYKLSRINLIDTSRWYEKLDGQFESINDFNWQMTTALLRNIEWKKFKLNHDKGLYDLFMTYKYFEHIPSIFLDFINELELKVSEYKGYKVKTIKDLKIND